MAEYKPKADLIAGGFFALRTPLLPFDELVAWGEGLESSTRPLTELGSPLEEALRADRARLRERLRTVVARPEVRAALFVASPGLEEQLKVWLEKPDSEAGQKIERSLVKYFARMAGRATPFGLFAGCSVGTLGSQTRLELAERIRYQPHSRLDMDYLVALAEALDRDPELRQSLTYRPNSSLYTIAGRVHYQEYRTGEGEKGRTHHAVRIEDSPYLQSALNRASQGAKIEALVATLLEADPEATVAEAQEYVVELIDNQLLVSDLAPTLTGAEPILGLIAQLRTHPAAAVVAERLDQVRQELAAIDAEGSSVPERYRAIARRLVELPAKVDAAKLFQVDLVKPVETATLGEAVVDELRRGVELLHRMARRGRQEELARFREKFSERYQGQGATPYEARWVPLVEVLDEELGIGFGTVSGTPGAALVEGLDFPVLMDDMAPWGKREAFLLRKLSAALARQREGEAPAEPLVLTPSDLDELAVLEPPPLPTAFAVRAEVAASSDEALASGDFQILFEGASGPSGASLLGRFCQADPELCRHVESHLRAEEALDQDAVYAEVVHLPEEGRIGNILARPVFRDFEIVYLGQSGAPTDQQIPITDLQVTVQGDQIVLRSQRLGRRVIPRLTSAHNFIGQGKGLYRFLCLLQSQGQVSGLGWDWGALGSAPFLPRVVAGRLVLSRARWLATKDELKDLGKAHGPARYQKVQEWRGRRKLPRWIVLADYDNELPLDLDNVLCVETFVELVKQREQAVLLELFPGPDQMIAHGPEGRFVHEIVVPFVQESGVRGQPAGVRKHESGNRSQGSVARRFPPGSEWLYVKLYTGPALTDEVLRDVVRPATDSVLRSGAADRWFFIRYGDPDWHLRLRYHGQPDRLLGEVFPALQSAAAPFLEDGRIWRMQIDTYEREVERYGGPAGMELAEQLFQADSEAVLALAGRLAEDAQGDLRWRLTLRGMDFLLDDLGLDLEARRTVLQRLRDGFAREFKTGKHLKHQLGDKHRKERKRLESLFNGGGNEEALAHGLDVLLRRSERLSSVTAELRTKAASGTLTLPLAELATSFLHMHANRLLRAGQRAQEMVLYDLLYRVYESQAARQKKTVVQPVQPVQPAKILV